MDFGMNMLEQLEPEAARELIPRWLCSFMELNPTGMASAIEKLEAALSVHDDDALARSLSTLRSLGDNYEMYRSDPVAQTMTRSYMRVLMEGSEISGI